MTMTKASIESLVRLYYLRHSFSRPDLLMQQWFMFIGFGSLVDLATTDVHGIVRLYTSAGSLNKFHLAPHHSLSEPELSDLDAVVDLYWLPTYPAELRVS